jgi:Bacterial proteasome activator
MSEEPQEKSVVVVGPDGSPIVTNNERDDDPARLIEQPAKVMRIGTMIKQLLEEVRSAPLDEKGRKRLMEIHRRSIVELEDGLSTELREELERISISFEEETTPSESELRIAQAQLVGWLEGLFHGIQAALVAQQMAARMQLEQMRGRPALPPGFGPTHDNDQPAGKGPGQYL